MRVAHNQRQSRELPQRQWQLRRHDDVRVNVGVCKTRLGRVRR
jgi:hypothetical protein